MYITFDFLHIGESHKMILHSFQNVTLKQSPIHPPLHPTSIINNPSLLDAKYCVSTQT